MAAVEIPSHVPAALVRDFDYADMGDEPDIYRHFGKLHDGPDIIYTPYYGGHWIFTRYEDMNHVFTHPDQFCSSTQSIPKNPQHVTLIEDDGERHTAFRKLLQPFFSPKSIGSLETIATDLTVSLIAEFQAKGECEFVADFGQRMPIIIAMNLLALPLEDTPYLQQISDDLVRSCDEQVQMAAFMRVFQYFSQKVIPERMKNPGKDMVSAILHNTVDGGRKPTSEEILSLCGLLIAGGLDTVASMLAFFALFLARNPKHRQLLIDDPALIPAAVEELLRRHHILNFGRTVVHDMVYKGVQLKAGDFILTPTVLAGIDHHHYADPQTVDFHREDTKHLVFAKGPHQCIGSYLARTELRVFLVEWLKRIPHFTIKEGEEPILVTGKASSIRYLPLTWSTDAGL